MPVIDLIASTIQVTPELGEAVRECLSIEHHKKGKLLIKEGAYCKKMYFIQQGLMRFYYVNDAGKDITHWFGTEETVITELDSFFKDEPSRYFLETLEDCVLYSITLEKVNYLLDRFPQLERFGRLIMMEMLLELGEKIKNLQFRTGKERYEIMLKQHPDIARRATLGQIASYLGMTQQSLSRIRTQI